MHKLAIAAMVISICVFIQPALCDWVEDVYQKASNALCVISYSVEDEMGTRPAAGQGICIGVEDGKGLIMTLAFASGLKSENIKDLKIILPSQEQKSIKAEFVNIDAVTGIGFVKAMEQHDWSIITFVKSANVGVGQKVVSVGLMPGEVGNKPYLGMANVSAVILSPEAQVYVTGGSLTDFGSPVFREDGNAIGLVANQPPMNFQMESPRGAQVLPLRSQLQSLYFLPVDEFAEAIADPGKSRQIVWLGAMSLEGLRKETAKDMFGVDGPAVMIDQIVPGGPADKAGLKNRDVVTAIDGKPLDIFATPEMAARDFARRIIDFSEGQDVSLSIVRDKQPMTVTVKLEPMPTRPEEAPRYFNQQLGVRVREKVMLDSYMNKSLETDIPGLLVAGILRDGAAEKAGLANGDLITAVNDQQVKSVDSFKQIVEGSLAQDQNKTITLLIRRGDQTQAISIQPSPLPAR